jgi:nucleoid-associated protein YgaU
MKVVCPVSGTENEDRTECKQCGTDLRPLIQVAEFPVQLILEGTQCLLAGQYLDAVESLSAAVSLSPELEDAHWKLGEAFAGLRKYDLALSHLDRALQLAPEREDIQSARLAVAKQAADAEKTIVTPPRNSALALVSVGLVGCALGLALVIGGQKLLRRPQPVPNWSAVIEQRISADPITRGLNLKVTSQTGAVQIAGVVPSDVYRELVLKICCHDATTQIDSSQLRVISQPLPLNYHVKPGDSWWKIARKEYGIGAVWPQIQKANQRQSSTPDRLMPGETLALLPITLAPR